MAINEEIRQFILENFMYSDDSSALTGDMSLIDSGIIDSTGVLELVGYIEETYGILVDDTELIPENFDSVDRIAQFIQRKLA